jgi:hypothetical protein
MKGLLARLACLILMAGLLPVAANHIQTDSGKAIVFDHKTGNDWWVEVVLSGAAAPTVVTVNVMEDSNNVWRPLEKKSWGAWGASYRFGSDADVRFRATWSDGTQAVSCWFDHPGGTERCDGAAPPAGWRAAKAFQSGPPGNSWAGYLLAAGDLDGNGRDEIFVPTEDGLMVHDRNTDGTWTTQLVFPQPRENDGRAQVTVGDVDGDLKLEVYSSGWNGNGRDLLYSTQWHGTGYATNLILQQSLLVQDLEVGDIKETGDAALYVTAADGFSQKATYVIDRPLGGFYSAFTISNDATGELGIGDPERDGGRELWTEGNHDDTAGFRVVDHVGGVYMTGAKGPDSPDQFMDVLVLDGDGDGKEEIYVLRVTSDGAARVDRHSYNPTSAAWSTAAIPIPTHHGAGAIAFGDADLDGTSEFYVGDFDGRVVQVKWTGSAWAVQHVATIGSGIGISGLLFADGDGDGRDGMYAYGSVQTGFCCPPIEVWNIAFAGPAPPPPPGVFDATFTGVRGNEWWVQANVAVAGGTLARVDMHINSGEWLPLTKQSWGGWAASYHISQSNLVQFRATSTTGAVDLSDCYRWIPAPNTDAPKCGNEPPPPFDAQFSDVKGNNWWVETTVKANQPITKVEARVDCGATWQTLTLQSWGSYAKSFNVPSGTKVDFRATSTSGGADFSGAYIWPNATPTTGC